jgi:hypothetical protein
MLFPFGLNASRGLGYPVVYVKKFLVRLVFVNHFIVP